MNEKLLFHDSETLKHVNEVRKNVWKLIQELDKRAFEHDKSKFESPEREIYAENLEQLGKVEYGSEEYKKLLEKVKPAIEHHYSRNRHHIEHWAKGIEEMDLIDLMEMICDWAAATKRNKNGNIHKSIEYNKGRFGISDQLASIMKNTVDRYF